MPLGLILCAEKFYECMELLRLEESEMYVAEYLADLPPRRLLEAKLHEAIRLAREQIAVWECGSSMQSLRGGMKIRRGVFCFWCRWVRGHIREWCGCLVAVGIYTYVGNIGTGGIKPPLDVVCLGQKV